MSGPGLASGGKMMEIKEYHVQVSNMSKGLLVKTTCCGRCENCRQSSCCWHANGKTITKNGVRFGLPLICAELCQGRS